MTSPVLALRRAVLDIAANDEELKTLMGGTLRLYDEPPRGAEPVYALFGDVKAEDWSTDLDRGHEQHLTLDSHCLVNLRMTELASERDKDTQLTRVTLRFRAVTERV